MTTKDFGMGFLGRNPFDKEARDKFQEKWNNMTDDEKLEFMNERVNASRDAKDCFSVEAIDARCEEWLSKTREEKEQLLNERKEAFQKRIACMKELHGHRGFGFGFFGRERENCRK